MRLASLDARVGWLPGACVCREALAHVNRSKRNVNAQSDKMTVLREGKNDGKVTTNHEP